MITRNGLLALIAFCIPLAQTHSALKELYVNGLGRGAGTCLRMNTISKTNMWVADITSDDMACGTGGGTVVGRTCPIEAGDTVSFGWRVHPNAGNDTRVIYASHWGPCSIYMKQISTSAPASDGSFPASPPAAGDGWFKIMYDVKDDAGDWCSERLRLSRDGVMSARIPKDLQSGYYLLHAEVMSLTHARQGNPQIYIGCAQVYVSGGTGTARPPTIAIPGYVHPDDITMKYNVYVRPPRGFPEIGGPTYKEGGILVYDTKNNVNSSQSSTSQSAARSTTSSRFSGTISASSSTTSGVGTSAITDLKPSTTAAAVPDNTAKLPVKAVVKDGTAVRGSTSTSTSASSPGPSCKGKRSRRMRRNPHGLQDSSFTMNSIPGSKLLQREQVARSPEAKAKRQENAFACPANTVMELGNSCLPAPPTWKDDGSSKGANCKSSLTTCWATAGQCIAGLNPAVDNTAGHGCHLYRDLCWSIKLMCQANVLESPSNLTTIRFSPPVGVLRDGGLMVPGRPDDGTIDPEDEADLT